MTVVPISVACGNIDMHILYITFTYVNLPAAAAAAGASAAIWSMDTSERARDGACCDNTSCQQLCAAWRSSVVSLLEIGIWN